MANAFKKTLLLSVVVVLFAALTLASVWLIRTETQPAAFAGSWNDFATDEVEMEGSGTYVDPFQIRSAEDLARMSLWINLGLNANSYYSLEADIDLSGNDFTPIGNAAVPFCGTFSGNGHKISGLRIAVEAGAGEHVAAGLFGTIGATGSVSSFGIVSGQIALSVPQDCAFAFLGSVAGENFGIVEDVYSFVNLDIELSAVVTKSGIGGIVAINYDGGMIRRAVFAGSVEAVGEVTALGGMVAENEGTVENVYNAGSVSTEDAATLVGGIAGRNSALMRYSLNAGPLKGTVAGAITAQRDSDVITFCYYDSDISGVAWAMYGDSDIDQDVNKIRGYTSQEFLTLTVSALRLPADYWSKYNKQFDGAQYYAPYLSSIHAINALFSETAAALRVYGAQREKWFDPVNVYGSAANPYLIETAAQFGFLSTYVNEGNSYAGKCFQVVPDTNGALDLTGFNGTVGTRGLTGGDKPFAGEFNGNNARIINYNIDRSSATSDALKRNIGLFGYIGENGHVYNFTLDSGCSIIAREYVGSVAGYNAGIIENIEIRASVRGNAFVGGIAGYNYSSGILRDILCIARLSGDVGASNIYGTVGDGSYLNSSNVWYVVETSAAYKDTRGKGRAMLIDLENCEIGSEPLTGNTVFGIGDGEGGYAHSVTVSKDSTGKVTFSGEAQSPWSVEYRFADQTVVSSASLYKPASAVSSETRNVYARLVRTLSANVEMDRESQLYFSKTTSGSTVTYVKSAKFYKGQPILMYSEVPQGQYLHKTTALIANGVTIEESPDFPFTYSSSTNDPRVLINFTMTESLLQIRPDFFAINAPSVMPKQYDGTGTLYMGIDTPYAVTIGGYLIEYSYSVAGGAPKNVGSYAITVTVRSTDGVRRGSQTVGYTITPKPIHLYTDMLTRQKEFDDSTLPMPAAVINQSGITDIVAGDAVVVNSTAAYASADIGWTTANFSFTIAGASAGNYIAPVDMVGIPCEIVRRSLIIEIDPEQLTYVYDGMASEIAYFGYLKAPLILAGLNPVPDVYLSKDIVHTKIGAVDVGSYDVNVRLKTGAQYDYNGKPITYYYTIELANPYVFTITPKPVAVTYGDYEGLVYNGAAQHIKAYYTDIAGQQVEIDPSCIAYTMTPGTGDYTYPNELRCAGSYTLKVTLPVSGNYVAAAPTDTFALSMAKANQPAIAVTPLTGPFVYGDVPRTLTVSGAAQDAVGAETFAVLSGNAAISGNLLEFTGAGGIYLCAYKAGDNNYYPAVSQNYYLSVEKAVIAIDIANIVKTYGDTLADLTFVFEGYVARDAGKTAPDGFVAPGVRIAGTGVDEVLNKLKKYDAGAYTLAVTQNASSTGYTFDYSALTPATVVTVRKKAVTVRPDDKTQTYGRADAFGQPESLPLTYAVYDGESALQASLSGIVLAREPGFGVKTGTEFYAIRCADEEAASSSNPNYDIIFAEGAYRITPKTLTVTAVSQTKHYGESDPAPLYTVSGLAVWDNESVVSLKNAALPSLVRQAGENAYYNFSREYGIYYYSASNLQLSANYTLSFVAGSLTIYKAVPVLESQVDMNVPYGDNIGSLQPSAVFKVNVGGQSRTVSGTVVWMNESARPVFNGANEFAAVFTPAADYTKDKLENNCASLTLPLAVGIYKRRIALTTGSTEPVYSGRAQRVAITLGNVLEGDTLDETIVYSADPVGAGEYTITVSIVNGNYTFYEDGKETDFVVIDMTVKKAPLLIYLADIELGEGVRPAKNFIYEGFVNGEDASDLLATPDVVFHTEAGNFEITPFGAQSDNYEITYRASKQMVTKTILTSDVQNLTVTGSFDYKSAMDVTELTKSANRSLFAELNSQFAAIKSINKLGNVTISRVYAVDFTVDGESAALTGADRATLEIPARLRESKKFYVVLVADDGTVKLAQNIERNGNNLSFDMEDCAMIGIVNPPDYTFLILGCVIVILLIAVFALDMVSEKMGIGRHKKKKAGLAAVKKKK